LVSTQPALEDELNSKQGACGAEHPSEFPKYVGLCFSSCVWLLIAKTNAELPHDKKKPKHKTTIKSL